MRANLSKKAEVYIGVIIAVGVLLMLSQTIVTVALSIYDFTTINRVRNSAKNIAQEELEIIRNTEYDNVGTVGGIPSGIFLQEQNVVRNGQNYVVRTRINYIDDPFDGVAPTDTLATDYKRVRVDVSWGGIQSSDISTITMVTDIAPKGVETTVGGGTLSVLVFNSNAEPVPQASVHLYAPTLATPIDATYYTSETGIITIPGAPVCNSCYEITVTKDGYSTDRTYSVSEVSNPIKPHATVLESELTEISFSIDFFASLQITSVDSKDNNFTILPNQIIKLRGEKIIGTDSLDQNVYKYDYDIVTNSLGQLEIKELEWDNYTLLEPDSSSIDIAYTNPVSPLSIFPSENINLNASVVPDTSHSLYVVFQDVNESLVSSVSATLKDSLSFEENVISGSNGDVDFGQVYFEGLENKIYTLVATASGFMQHTTNVTVNNDTKEIIILDTQ